MARIPLTVAGRTLDTGNVVSYPTGGQVGAAVAGFGDALQGAVARIQQKDEQKAGFEESRVDSEFRATQGLLEDQAVRSAPADGSGIHDSVYGQLDPVSGIAVKPGAFDKLFDEYLEKVPAIKRADFAAKREVYRKQGSRRLAGQQYDAEQKYYGVEIQKAQGQLVNSIGLMGDPNDAASFEAYKKEGMDLIEQSGLPPLEKDVAKANWEATSEEALVKAYIAKDPSKVRDMLGLRGVEPAPAGRGQQAPASVKGRAAAAMGYFTGRGYTKEQAAGIVGNLIAESRLNTGARNPKDGADGSDSIGIAQWNADRARGLKAFAAANHADWRDFNVQLAFVEHELNTTHKKHGDNLRAARDVQSATDAMVMFEGPAGSQHGPRNAHNYSGRLSFAQQAAGGEVTEGAPDPRVAHIPLDRRIVLANAADSAVREIQVQSRGSIEIAEANAPIAIQNTGEYSGQLPTQQDYQAAYGPQEGSERFAKFSASVETSKQANAFQTMSTDDVKAVVAGAAPASSGEGAALEQARYDILANAAAQIITAREKDPAAYVNRVYPSIGQAWQQSTPGNYQAAMTLTAAAQKQLGIDTMRLVPGDIAKSAVDTFKNEELPEQDRAAAAASLVFSTSDPEQRKAVFEQLVDAGLPEETAGALRAAERGDQGAATRLMQAAMIDPSKLPGKASESADTIDKRVQEVLMDEGQIGDLFYGLSDGSSSNFLTAQRDSRLLSNYVNLRLREGKSLDASIDAASKDLYGDLVPVEGNNAQILLGRDEDPVAVLSGLNALLPQVRDAIEAQMTIPADAISNSDGRESILVADRGNYIMSVLREGYFRSVKGGFVYMDPFTGTAVSDAKGTPILFPDDQVKAAASTRRTMQPANDAPLTDDAFDEFQRRMQGQ